MRSGAMRRFAKDESGMAMGLAIITMVLIGVMGAGLLTFVVTDLNSVVEVNQGQRAFEVADAGIQAAERQLASKPEQGSYDGGSGDVQWSFDKSNTSCPELGGRGMCLENLDATSGTDDSVNVTIESLSAESFEVVSTGGYGEAKRRIEAIYKRSGTGPSKFALGMYATGEVDIGGKPRIRDMSIFSGGNVDGTVITKAGKVPTFDGVDKFYGNWLRSPNTVARATDKAGIGAEVGITYDETAGRTARLGKTDYSRYSYPNFKSPPLTGNITYPFDPDLTDQLTSDDLAKLKAQAVAQGRYIETSSDFELSEQPAAKKYPKPSTKDTVYYVKFTGGASNEFYYDDDSSAAGIKGCGQLTAPFTNNCPQGTIVVENGDFVVSEDELGFKGTIVVRKTSGAGNSLKFESGDKFTLKGVANVQGNMILGSESVYVAPDPSELNPIFSGGLGKVELQSWRELYE